jgi:serine/threonine protein kinase
MEQLEVDPSDVVWHEDEPFAAGGFSTVWRVQYSGAVVAAKVIARTPGAQSIRKAEAWMHSVKKEAAILHRLSACPSIVNVIGLFEMPDGAAVVLMEYASGGCLRNYLHGSQPEDTPTGTGTGKSASTGTGSSLPGRAPFSSSTAVPRDPLPELPLPELLSMLIDIAQGMVFCYAQTPPVQHRGESRHQPLYLLRSHRQCFASQT